MTKGLENQKETTNITYKECSVCCEPLDPNKEEIVKLSCGHIYHYNCILQSYRAALLVNRFTSKRECPYCRCKGEYLELKPGMVPMRGIHKEYTTIRGRQIKIDFLKEHYFVANKCQSILVSGTNKHQQCSKKPHNSSPDDNPLCAIHMKKTKNQSYIYFPV